LSRVAENTAKAAANKTTAVMVMVPRLFTALDHYLRSFSSDMGGSQQ
jgi:hypothetical protein